MIILNYTWFGNANQYFTRTRGLNVTIQNFRVLWMESVCVGGGAWEGVKPPNTNNIVLTEKRQTMYVFIYYNIYWFLSINTSDILFFILFFQLNVIIFHQIEKRYLFVYIILLKWFSWKMIFYMWIVTVVVNNTKMNSANNSENTHVPQKRHGIVF